MEFNKSNNFHYLQNEHNLIYIQGVVPANPKQFGIRFCCSCGYIQCVVP